MWLKTIIVIFLIAIIVSLATGFYFLLNDKSQSKRLLTSLKVRITLSVLLMLLITLAWLHGDITSHAPWLHPDKGQPEQHQTK
ncbi:DUF2909 domain-containing protein [Endozoicomonadaceae bacterium StTr2]